MSSLYFHIPYCKSKCHYCNFYSVVNTKNKQQLLAGINKELKLRKDYLKDNKLKTIYFGGGTPSILSNNEIRTIFNNISKNYDIDKNCEITFEANPDDINREKLLALKENGVNRLSIGIQSFNNDILKKLNRKHSGETAIESVKLAKKYGFENISIDLIYGIPGLNNHIWKDSLKIFKELQIPHLSSYFLTVEQNTALDILIRKGKYPKLIEKEGIEHFEYLLDFCEQNNIEQYEISNFAKKGRLSQHNTNYWKNREYLGIGPSAHSYNGNSRQWNISSISDYILEGKNNFKNCEKEILTENDKFNEFVMLGLRTSWGVNLLEIKERFGIEKMNFIKSKIINYKKQNYLISDNENLILSKSGKIYADGIASYFFDI